MKTPPFFSKHRWVLPLVIVIALLVLALPLLRKKEETGSPAERAARKSGVTVPQYLAAERLSSKAEKGTLDDAEWSQVLALYQGTRLRTFAVQAMMFSGKTKHRQEALSIMRPKLSSANPRDQVDALLVLRYFNLNEPDWRQECEKRVQSSDSEVHYMATTLLANDTQKTRP